MAHRLTFHYFPGNSFLHRWDARCKFFGLLISTLGLLHMRVEALIFFSILFLGILVCIRLPWKALLSDFKAWGFFLLLIFLVQASFHPTGEPSILPWLPVSTSSLNLALLTCWRLGLILCYASLFTFVTRPRELQHAISWFLKPFPFLPARRIAMMIALTMRFLPMVLDQLEDVRTATRSRAGNLRKNPLLRAKFIVLPLFRRSLSRADELALALAARGYREDLPPQLPRVPQSHLMALFFFILVVLLSSTGVVFEL